jgi:hypothetical protein
VGLVGEMAVRGDAPSTMTVSLERLAASLRALSESTQEL